MCATSPDLKIEMLNAILDALEAHTTMSSQAIGSEKVQEGLKEILLGPGQLYEGCGGRRNWRSFGRANDRAFCC